MEVTKSLRAAALIVVIYVGCCVACSTSCQMFIIVGFERRVMSHTSSLNFISDFHCFHRNSRFLFSNFERWVRYSRNFLIFMCNDALFLFVSAAASSTVRPSSKETIKQSKIGETRSLAFFTPDASQHGLLLIIHND